MRELNCVASRGELELAGEGICRMTIKRAVDWDAQRRTKIIPYHFELCKEAKITAIRMEIRLSIQSIVWKAT